MPVIEIAPVTSAGDQAPPLLAFVPLSPERRRAVKRRLFSDIQDGESLHYASRQLEQQYEEQKLRWNFDFLNERPLAGRYDWQPVNRSTTTTAWLCQQPHNTKRSRIDSSSADVPVDPQPLPTLVVRKPKEAQTKITDFMRLSKSSDHVSTNPKSRSSSSGTTPTARTSVMEQDSSSSSSQDSPGN